MPEAPAKEHLLKFVGEEMQRLKHVLEKTGDFRPAVKLVMPDQSLNDLPLPPWFMEDAAAKNAVAHVVRDAIKQLGVIGVIISSDAWTVEYSDDDLRRMKEDQAAYKRYEEACLNGGSVDDVVATGFGTKVECIMVNASTPDYSIIVRQVYTRDKRKITFGAMNTQEMNKSDGDRYTGRFVFWGTE